jgi:hypothetical protein
MGIESNLLIKECVGKTIRTSDNPDMTNNWQVDNEGCEDDVVQEPIKLVDGQPWSPGVVYCNLQLLGKILSHFSKLIFVYHVIHKHCSYAIHELHQQQKLNAPTPQPLLLY